MLAVVLGASVLARVMSAAFGHVVVPLDAWSFRETAAQFASGDLHGYNGARGPVFPLLLIASGGSEPVLLAIHAAIGCVVAMVLSYVTLAETRSRLAAIGAGCLIGLGFYGLAFESSVMSECLVSLWLVAALATARTLLSGESSTARMATLGLFVGLAILTRPMFLYLVPVFAWALRRSATPATLAFAATSFGMVVAWSLVNFVVVGSFGPTTLLGFNLTNHTGAFIERAPPEFVDIRDVYLEFRAVRIAEYGNHHQTIWDALPALEKVTGQSFATLSRRCASMSAALILACPGRYLASVADAVGRFMLAPNCRGSPWFPPHGPFLAAVWDVQEAAFVGAKAVLVALTPFAYRGASALARLMIAVFFVGTVFQALLEVGENDRYSVPLQPWAVSAALVLVWSLRRRETAPSAAHAS